MGINRVLLLGRITKELEVRQTTSGTAVLRFTVAVDRPVKQGEKQTDFINCVAFGQRAEFISRYFGKGRMIAIEGNIKTGSYEKNGVTTYTTDVWVDAASFTGESRNENNGGSSGGYGRQGNLLINAPNTAYNAGQTAYSANDYEDVINDDGIPF